MRTGTGEAIPSLSDTFIDATAQVIMIPIEAIPDHDIGIIAIITLALMANLATQGGDVSFKLMIPLQVVTPMKREG